MVANGYHSVVKQFMITFFFLYQMNCDILGNSFLSQIFTYLLVAISFTIGFKSCLEFHTKTPQWKGSVQLLLMFLSFWVKTREHESSFSFFTLYRGHKTSLLFAKIPLASSQPLLLNQSKKICTCLDQQTFRWLEKFDKSKALCLKLNLLSHKSLCRHTKEIYKYLFLQLLFSVDTFLCTFFMKHPSCRIFLKYFAAHARFEY